MIPHNIENHSADYDTVIGTQKTDEHVHKVEKHNHPSNNRVKRLLFFALKLYSKLHIKEHCVKCSNGWKSKLKNASGRIILFA